MKRLSFLQTLLVRLFPKAHRDFLVGDLLEEFHRRGLDKQGRRSGRRWLRRQIVRAVVQNLGIRIRYPLSGALHSNKQRQIRPKRSHSMGSLFQDLRHSFRVLARYPGVTAVAVFTLTLGVGANTAIFSVLNAVLIKPFPYAEPDRLVTVWMPWTGYSYNPLSDADWLDLQEATESFEALGAYEPGSFNLSGDDNPVRVSGVSLTTGVLSALGVTPALGRLFVEEETDYPTDRVVIVSDRFWKSRFASRTDLIGSEIRINRENHTVIGIMPEGFRFPGWQALNEPDVLLPLPMDLSDLNRGAYYLRVIGRLRDGLSFESAGIELNTIASRLAEAYPETNRERTVQLVPLEDIVLGNSASRIWILLGVTGIVLLIACTNVAGLLLSRNAGRNVEMAVRASLGAGKSRLLRLMLTEGVVFALIGGTVGLLAASWGMSLLRGASASFVPRADQIGIDVGVILFTYGVAILTGLLFGILPALTSSRVDLTSTLRQGARTNTAGKAQTRFLGAMIVGQFALTFVLANGAALMLRSLWQVTGSRELFEPGQVLVAGYLQPTSRGAEEFTPDQFLDQLLERLRGIPGVSSAGATSRLPLEGGWTVDLLAEGQDYDPAVDRGSVHAGSASPGFFQAMGINLIQGRDFSPLDFNEEALGVVVNRTFAESRWPGEIAVGKRVRANATESWFEGYVVGVVEDVRQQGLENPAGSGIYFPFFPSFLSRRWIALRTEGDPFSVVPAVRQHLAALDPHLPLTSVFTGADIYDLVATQRRLITRLIVLFATVALCLVVGGTYGVMAFLVRQRNHEMGVRVALGASRNKVMTMVLNRSLRLATAGIVLGVLGAVLASGVIESMLYGVRPLDITFLMGAAVFLLLLAACAAAVPALRAMRADPVEVMRAE